MTTRDIRNQTMLPIIGTLVRAYVVIAVLTVVALAILSAVAPDQAPRDAWVHAVIVVVFAALLPVRLRSAQRVSVAALRAVGIISVVLFLANVIEAMIPDFAPGWMRIEMIVIALVMLGIIGSVVRERV
ncbi:hypothetical protein ASG12_04685 [Williamsia sp. Leaf354]|uniref:hypothetical protein n=1 Tax=Williamsia sp. Leaf354 TaxID=1736349 RepID=UPI0006F8B371|nr:hypothetical protein [Williamsia sp. Leaf354]KQS00242.1 hypothetical protein ASG12_04685 [Williamsia sp. Leaf354]